MLASSMVKHGFKPQSSQAIDYKIGICCFSTKYTALWSKKKDWLVGIRIVCQNGMTCLPVDCCFSGIAL